jgi:hypothetical protein
MTSIVMMREPCFSWEENRQSILKIYAWYYMQIHIGQLGYTYHTYLLLGSWRKINKLNVSKAASLGLISLLLAMSHDMWLQLGHTSSNCGSFIHCIFKSLDCGCTYSAITPDSAR